MSFFAMAVLLGWLGAGPVFIDPNIQKGKTKVLTLFTLATVYTFIGWLILWSALPSLAWPLFGLFGGLVIIWWIITCVVGIIINPSVSDDPGWSHGWWFPIGAIIIIIVTLIGSSSIFRARDYAALIGQIDAKTQKHWSQDVQPLDPTHIRLVPPELAISLAKTALTDGGTAIGSQFPLDSARMTIQKVNGDYWYLVPLDFDGFRIWTSSKHQGAPGYIKVSATDPYLKPTLVLGKSLVYTPNACFDKNLQRHLYQKYKDKVLKDLAFEEDENGNVYWVASVCRPTIAYGGLIVEGVVLCDPKTGEMTFISKDDVAQNPKYAWIDRALPQKLVEKYIDDWGTYKDGWWNAVWSKKNLLEGETPTINYASDEACVFVTPITSTNGQDQTMTGLMYTDSQTGKATYYTISGGATEEAVIQAVNNNTGYKNWHGSEQIVYENVYGKLSALVPVLGKNGNYQGLAIVENENKRCAVGLTPQEALIEFQKMIMNSGGEITTENAKNILEFTGKLQRIGWEISGTGKQYYLFFDNFSNSFIVSNALQSELSLTEKGDEIYIKYISSGQAAVPIMFFKNITLNLKASENEQKVIGDMTEKQNSIREKADVKDFKEELKTMSDDEIKALMKNKK